MAGVSLPGLLIVIIVTATPACSQFVTLTTDREIVCIDDETVPYTCSVGSSEVQWIAEPFIPAIGQNEVIIGNLNVSVGTTIPRTGMIVEHVSFDPFLTNLTIDVRVVNSLVNVTCSTSGLTPERTITLQYNPNDGLPIQPVSSVNATPIVNDVTDQTRSILVNFVPSPSLGITNYIINCTDGSCQQRRIGAMEDDAVVETSSSRSSHTVCVYAVNRCERMSEMKCSEVKFPDLCQFPPSVVYGLSAALVVMIFFLVVVVAVLIGYCMYVAKSQKRIGNEGAVGFSRNEGVDVSKQQL